MDSATEPLSETMSGAHGSEQEHVGHDEQATSLFGFIIFLLSESVIFLSFFAGYIVLKTTALNWLPDGVEGLEVSTPAINTVVLVSSSFVIYFAEEALKKHQMWLFRGLWLLTSASGVSCSLG